MDTNKTPKYLLETDTLVNYLTFQDPIIQPYLLNIMQKGICFTSVLNAAELFMCAKSDLEKEKVKDLLYALKVLGLPARYSLSITDLDGKINNTRDALFYILAEKNKLSIVSFNTDKYKGLKVPIISPDKLV
ncbi:MAG: PIN domain-containing protein [Ignavibacterium sp.]|nr:PIN domain-containing protein [Ignavibacterium sp.]